MSEIIVSPSVAVRWKLWMAIGVVHVLMGLAALFWPDATLTVLVVIVGIELLLAGVLRVLVAATDDAMDSRVLHVLLGLVSVVLGLLVMREPIGSLAVVVAVLGIFWVLWGLVELFISLTPAASGLRLPLAVEGGLAVLGGGILLSWPGLTLRGLTLIVGILLVLGGGAATWTAWQMRRPEATSAPGPLSTPAVP
jgi:uncharacterized membrane protein HdeD (DUF308 family)